MHYTKEQIYRANQTAEDGLGDTVKPRLIEAAAPTRNLKVQNAESLRFALSHFHYTDHRPMC